jgi:hypothetical protein
MSFGALRDLSMHLPDGTPLALKLADGRELKMVLRDIAPR